MNIAQIQHSDARSTLYGAIYGLTAAAVWGGMYVVSDLVLPVIPPFTLLSIRLIIAAFILGALVSVQRGGLALPAGRDRLTILGVGVIGFGISVGAQFVGTDLSTAVNGTLITSASPAFILVFAATLLRERLSPRRILAVVLATVGVIVIINPASADFSSATFAGDIALAIAAITWGLYSVLVRRVSARYDTLVISLYAMLGGLILTIPAAAIELATRPVGAVTPSIVLGVIYLGVISTAYAMWAWNRAFALVDASAASLFFFAQPLVGTLLSVLLLNQTMTLPLWIGSALIGIGVVLAMLGGSAQARRIIALRGASQNGGR
ncbi:MAG: DMT family transporter [Anaerolinea sp.]|nr:DMT family transporter [Anaerolinea sp.]